MIKQAIKRTALFIIAVILNLTAGAAIESINTRIENPHPSTNNFLTVADNKFGMLSVIITDVSYTAKLEFGLNEAAKQFYTQSKIKFQITCDITLFTTSSSVVHSNQVLEVIYDRLKGTTYIDKATWIKTGYNRMDVKIKNLVATDLSGATPVVLSSAPLGTYLEGQIETERYYSIAQPSIIAPNASNRIGWKYIAATNEYEIYWGYFFGAEEYDLEWTFVSVDGSAPASSYSYTFKNNATRITTTNNWYRIPNMYSPGYVAFRIRSVGGPVPNGGKYTNLWSTDNPGSPETGIFSAYPANMFFYTSGVPGSKNLNWSSTATFDENGRQGTAISYADGLLKNRQEAALLNSEGKTIIQSTYYDYNGRPAINFLPTPVSNGELKYYINDYKKSSSSVTFDKDIYDADNTSSSACNVTNVGVDYGSSRSDAANYYSQYNFDGESEQKMTPNAFHFPFVQVEYTPDLTGRIKSSSLPGPTHAIGSGHETKYFYGNPGNQELDRLFGSEVGNSNHYQKNAVVDANGQTSVSYLDMSGRVIATALTGNKPNQVDAIPSYASSAVTLSDDLLTANKKNSPNYTIESTKTIFVEADNTVQQIIYDLDQTAYADACAPLCFDCIYELEISIKDECNNELMDLQPSVPGIQNTVIVGDINSLDGTCGTTSPIFSLPSSPVNVTFPKAGSYIITKKLKVSDIPISTYADLFLANNTCLPKLADLIQDEINNIDFSSCNFTCVQCSTSLVAYNAAHPLPTAVFNQLMAECNAQCEDDPCEQYRESMMHDLIPGGQYATYNIGSSYTPGDNASIYWTASNWQTTSITYKNEDGSTYQFVDDDNNPITSIGNVTLKQFIEQFQDHWAEYFLPLHPEYAYLEFCNSTAASLKYDELMRNTDTYDAACRLGLITPISSGDFSSCSLSSPAGYPSTTCAVGTYTANYDPFFMASPSSTDPTKAIVANSNAKCLLLNEMVSYNSINALCTCINLSNLPGLSGNFLSNAANTPSGFSNPGCGTGATQPNPAESIYQFATQVANCAGNTSCSYSGGFGTGCNKDLEWKIFRSAYLTKKQIIYEKIRATNAIAKGCYNGAMASGGTSYLTSQMASEFKACTPPLIFSFWDPNPSPTPYKIQVGFGCATNYKGDNDNQQRYSGPAYVSTYQPKIPRFFDISMMGNTAVGSYATNLTGSSSGSGPNAMSTSITQQGTDFCNNTAANWMLKLEGCINPSNSLPITDPSNSTLYNNIKAGLIDVCSRGVDVNNPFGVSSGAPTSGSTPPASLSSFSLVLNTYLGTTESHKPTCNAMLISFPPEKDHSLTSGATNTQKLDKCACDKIFMNETIYSIMNTISLAFSGQPLPFSEVDYFNQNNIASANFITPSLYNKLKCACKTAAGVTQTSLASPLPFPWTSTMTTNLSNLGSDYTIIGDMGCPHCKNCNEIAAALTSFTTSYSCYSPSSTAANYQQALTTYLNQYLNFNLTYDDYHSFFSHCTSEIGAGWGSGLRVGSGSWLAGAKYMNISNLNDRAYDFFNFLQNNIDSLIDDDTLRPAKTPDYFKQTLYPYLIPESDLKVRYKGYTSSGGTVLNMAFINSNTMTPIYDTITLTMPATGSRTFSDLKQILEFYGRTDTSYYGHMRGFYLTGVFAGGGSANDTMLISGFTNGYNFSNRISAGSAGCGSGAECLCNKTKFEAYNIKDDCYTSLINNATINAQDKYADLLTKAKADFILAYKNACFNATETFNRTYNLYEHHYTLYYYDQAGNLTRTVPPKGVHPLTSSGDLATAKASHGSSIATRIYPKHDFNTNYKYQTNNATLNTENPDENGPAVYFYDFRGRIVASQNKKQQANYQYVYTLYDQIGRITEVGLINGTSSSTPLTASVARDPSAFASFLAAYGAKSEVTQTYYDTYISSTINSQFTSGQNNLRYRVATVTYEETFNSSATVYDYATHYSYDDHGNVVEMIQDKPNMSALGLQYKKINYEYDLISGNINKIYYEKTKADQFIHKYEYDADNRLKAVFTSIDNIHWDKDAKYFYYKHGPLARAEIGDKQVQGIDFAYTIHGWVKGINSEILNVNNDIGRDGKDNTNVQSYEYNSFQPNVHGDFANDAASYNLNYFFGDYAPTTGSTNYFKALANSSNLYASSSSFNLDLDNGNGPNLYNGNISSMVTTITNLDPLSSDYLKPMPQLAAFRYDQLHRITQMTTYADIVKTSGVIQNNWNIPSGTYNDYKMTFAYDANGNISNLTRNGSTATGLSMDNLTYTNLEITGLGNTKTNKLIGVADAVTNVNLYNDDIDDMGTANPSDVTKASWNYDYDDIGNLIQDKQEHIATILWTADRKVRAIIRDGSPKVVASVNVYLPDLEYEYDANRQRTLKLEKPRDASGIKALQYWKWTHYVRDAQGQVLAIYNKHYELISGTSYNEVVEMEEQPIYGSSRIGVYKSPNKYIRPCTIVSNIVTYTGGTTNPPTPWTSAPYSVSHEVGDKQFEISNHLGNVLATVSDKKIPTQTTAATFSNNFDGNNIANQNSTYFSSSPYSAGLTTPSSTPPGVYPSVAFSSSLRVPVNPGDVVVTTIKGYYVTTPPSGSAGMLVYTLTDASGNVLTVSSVLQWFTDDVNAGSRAPNTWNNLSITKTIPTVPGYNGQLYVTAFAWNPVAPYSYYDDISANVTYANGIVKNYTPDYISSQDYYAFGQLMPGRNFNANAYRYGHNGQESETEISGGQNNNYSAEYWIYDARLGRRWEKDPVVKPWESPYATFRNNPIYFSDPLGLDGEKPNEKGHVYDCGNGTKEIFDGKQYVPYVSLNEVEVAAKGVMPITNYKSYIYDAALRAHSPRLIDQGKSSLCGPACIAMALATHDDLGYLKVAADLYWTGVAKYGNYKMKSSSIMTDIWYSGQGSLKISSVDWMVLGSIRNTENGFFDYGGFNRGDLEGASAFTTPSEMSNIATQMGFEITENSLNVAPGVNGVDNFFGRANQHKKDGCTVIMLVNSDALQDIGAGGTPNHYIIYAGNYARTEDGTISFDAITWGGKETFKINIRRFDLKAIFGMLSIKK